MVEKKSSQKDKVSSNMTTVKKSKNEKIENTKTTEDIKQCGCTDCKCIKCLKCCYKKEDHLWKGVAAEFIGTLALGCALMAVQGEPLFMMFVLAGIVLLFGSVSGAHFNPAVSICAWISHKIDGLRAVAYIIAQVIGAIFAKLLMTNLIYSAAASTSAAKYYQASALPENQQFRVFIAELIGSFIVIFAANMALRAKKGSVKAALTYGFGYFVALAIVFYGVTYALGATSIFNPALALTLGVTNNVTSFSTFVWPAAVYFLSPIVGGLLAVLVEQLIMPKAIEQEQ